MKRVVLYRHNEAAGPGRWQIHRPSAEWHDDDLKELLGEMYDHYTCAKSEKCRGLEGYWCDPELAKIVVEMDASLCAARSVNHRVWMLEQKVAHELKST